MSTQAPATPIGAVFADPAGVGATLQRRRPVRPAMPDAARQATGEQSSRQADAGERRKSKPATARRSDTIVYVTAPQAAWIRTERQATGRTVTEVVLSAVEDAANDLAGAFHSPPRPSSGRLFQGSTRPKTESDPSGKVQVCLRMIKSDRDALDRLAADAGAPSRSHLIRKALELRGRAK